jgi:hypothetical protein
MMTFDAIVPLKFASGASWKSPFILCAGYARVEFWVMWEQTGMSGTLRLRGGPAFGDSGEGFADGDTPNSILDTLAVAAGDGNYGAWPTVGAAAGVACIVVANPVARMGIGYTHISGPAQPDVFTLYAVRSR